MVYHHFFEKFPTLESLAGAEQSGIEEVLRPLGFWKIRARDLKLMAMQIIEENSGNIPTTKESLLGLHGIGRYIATAFYCFALGQKEAVIDVNVRKVAKRLFFWQESLPADPDLERFLLTVMPSHSPKDFNWALLDFSSKVCSRNPHCESCFATSYCQYYKSRFDGGTDQINADIA